ncbi:DnaA regulatory inactivator Hda [Burkholderia multivorans]|nr:DnaA regulatory inactivator Hda [Burkholderia multivorans ATCC 17616]MBJ9940936.1 DnaA regulatory inactivator Hda [Burkholderia multivorans]MBR7892618.1 DnaA regulatory inactivator Hda [Burkholderia multivorans]MBR8451389.1 DnaA regulatory inactivator Hda [Burkholderia multivorans]MCO8626784.1 DnaA regulatory inactivator Hda [Burkholderia multivorans]
MRFYPKPARWPEFPASNRQGSHLGQHVPVFLAERAAHDAARRPAYGRACRQPACVPRCVPGTRHAFFQSTRMVTRQLTLDLGTPPPATFDNFITGENGELVTRLQKLDLALAAGPVPDRSFYIWGEPGSGRSHLLQALVSDASYGYARYLTPQSPLGAFTFDPRIGIYAIDDCDRMSDTQQVALFNLFNEVRAHPSSAFVAAGPAAPLALDVREDLRTRLGWGLVFHLSPLSDAGKIDVLRLAAKERGITLTDDVAAYLLTHFRRDMPSLMALLDALDRFSLEQKRAVTLPLLRRMLARPGDDIAPPGTGPNRFE